MSTIIATCRCGKTFKAPAQFAGKRGQCRACGATVEIPDAPPEPELVDDLGLPPVADDDDHPARRVYQKSAPPSDPHPVVAAERIIPPEPWYYRFLNGFAACIMGFGLTACGAAAIFGAVHFAQESARERKPGDPPPTEVGLALVGMASAAVVPVLLASAPVFLAVDAARNLRAMRYKPADG